MLSMHTSIAHRVIEAEVPTGHEEKAGNFSNSKTIAHRVIELRSLQEKNSECLFLHN